MRRGSTGNNGSLGSSDLQAVILCGPGHRLSPVTGDESLVIPKCLIPVANKPMLHYPLTMLANAGICDIIVVVHTSIAARVQHFLSRGFDAGNIQNPTFRPSSVANSSNSPATPSPVNNGISKAAGLSAQQDISFTRTKPELVAIDEYRGTVDALLTVRRLIRRDCIVLPCDLVTDYPLLRLIEQSRLIDDALFISLLVTPLALNYGQKPKVYTGARSGTQSGGINMVGKGASGGGQSGEPKHRLNDEGGVLVGLGGVCENVYTESRRLLYLKPIDEIDDGGSASFPMALLGRHPILSVRSDLVDTHCYLLRHEFFYPSDPKRFQDLFRLSSPVHSQLGNQMTSVGSITSSASVIRSKLFSIREELVPRIVTKQFGAQEYHKCAAIVVDSGYYCIRVNTLSALSECSKQLARIAAASQPLMNAPVVHNPTLLLGPSVASAPSSHQHHISLSGAAPGAQADTKNPITACRLISQAAEIGQKTQIGADSMVGDHTIIGDKSSVKRSVLGAHVRIGNNVRISNCLIMDHAVVEGDCKLEGCILGPRASVYDHCQLRDCDVGAEQSVERETVTKGELFGGKHGIFLES